MDYDKRARGQSEAAKFLGVVIDVNNIISIQVSVRYRRYRIAASSTIGGRLSIGISRGEAAYNEHLRGRC